MIKEGKKQPISSEAAIVGLEAGQNFDEEQYNAIIKVFSLYIIKINTFYKFQVKIVCVFYLQYKHFVDSYTEKCYIHVIILDKNKKYIF